MKDPEKFVVWSMFAGAVALLVIGTTLITKHRVVGFGITALSLWYFYRWWKMRGKMD